MTDEIKNKQYEARNSLLARLETNELEDDFDLCSFIQFSGRLASLGDTTGLDKLPSILAQPKFAGRLEDIIKERVNEGVWDLNEQLEEDLGHSIIEAQDFYCFLQHGGKLITENILNEITRWVRAALDQELDDEAVDLLERYLITYPLAEDDQIAPVAAPLASWQIQMLNMVLLPKSILNYTGENIDGVWTCKVKRGSDIITFRKYLDGNHLVVTVSDNCPTIDRLRVGAMPMEQREKGKWVNLIPMDTFGQEHNERLATQFDVVVTIKNIKLMMK